MASTGARAAVPDRFLLPLRRSPAAPVEGLAACARAAKASVLLGAVGADVKRLALLALTACVSTKSAESTLRASEDVSAAITQRVETGPERVVTTVEEFGPGPAPEVPPDAVSGRSEPTIGAPAGVRGPPLVKRTVTITERGPSSVTTGVQEHVTATVDAKAVETSKTAPAASCAFGGYLWALAVIAIAGAVFAAARRARP